MAIRVSGNTTAGRPRRALAVMVALFLATIVGAWAVSAYKAARPIVLDQPAQLPGVPLAISLPADWTGQQSPEPAPGLVAIYADGEQLALTGAQRRLLVFRFPGEPMTSTDLLASQFRQHRIERSRPAMLGPLTAREDLLIGQQQKHLTRTAILGPGQFFVVQLDVLGPPTPWEHRLMNRLAESVTLSAEDYPPLQQAAGALGLRFASPPDETWLATRFNVSHDLVVLPRAGRETSFWGLARVRPVLSRAAVGDLVMTAWKDPSNPYHELAETGRLRRTPTQVIQPTIPGVESAMARAEVEQLVVLVYAVRLEGASQAEPALAVWAWAALSDEPAARAAIEALIAEIRLRPKPQ